MSGASGGPSKRSGTHRFFSRAVKVGLLLGLLAVAGGVAYYAQTSQNDYTIHWHYTVSIDVYGHTVTVPAGIGINPALWNNHTLDRYATNPGTAPVHTHDSTGLIHIEATGPRGENYSLGYLFSIWGVRFSESCLSSICTSNRTGIQMFVNGVKSYYFGRYEPHDDDRILIQVEPISPEGQTYTIPADPTLCTQLLICTSSLG